MGGQNTPPEMLEEDAAMDQFASNVDQSVANQAQAAANQAQAAADEDDETLLGDVGRQLANPSSGGRRIRRTARRSRGRGRGRGRARTARRSRTRGRR